jgi:hypothetical protein
MKLYDFTINIAGEVILRTFFSRAFNGIKIDEKTPSIAIVDLFSDSN